MDKVDVFFARWILWFIVCIIVMILSAMVVDKSVFGIVGGIFGFITLSPIFVFSRKVIYNLLKKWKRYIIGKGE